MAGSPSLGLADQPNLTPGRQNLYLRVHAVNIFVRDQDRSLRFYLDQLGFSLAFDVRLQSGQRWVGVAPPNGTAVLTLIAPDPDSDEYKLIGRPTDVVFVTEDALATYIEWRRRGVRFRYTRGCGASSLNNRRRTGPGVLHPCCWASRRRFGAEYSLASKISIGTPSRWSASTK